MAVVTKIIDVLNYMFDNPFLFIVLFLIYGLVYILSKWFSRPKPGTNPLNASHVRLPPLTVVTDRAARKKILKPRFNKQKVPENIDTIVIGSGIGGLATAVLLGRAGHKVLVLEQHGQVGGCCHTFVKKGFEFDTGIHYLGDMAEGKSGRVLMDQITEGQVVFAPLDKEYDTVALGPPENAKRYVMMSGSREIFAANLERQFPTEKAAITKLMQLLEDCKKIENYLAIPKFLPLRLVKILVKTGLYDLIMRKCMRYCRLTLKEFLEEATDNKEFISVMSYIFGDMGVVPSKLNVVSYSMLMNHFIPGAYYPVGGPSEIALQIIPIIEKYGGCIFTDATVSKILINDEGRAHGVAVKCGSSDINIYANRIVSDAGVINTFKYMLPKEVAIKAPLYKYIDKVGPSISFLTAFVGLNGSSEELGMIRGNVWAFLDMDIEKDVQDYTSQTVEEAAEKELPFMFVSFPSAKDPSWDEKYPGKSVALMITLLPWKWFSKWESLHAKKRGSEYDNLKDRIGQQMWKQLVQLFPKFEDRMEYFNVGTPCTNKYYLGQPEGEMYGLDHRTLRFEPEISMHLRPKTGIPGLYLTGQDIMTCGFVSSLYAAVLTASSILHRNLFFDLETLTKEIKSNMSTKKAQ